MIRLYHLLCSVTFLALGLAGLGLTAVSATADRSTKAVRVAVAPFAGDSDAMRIAETLSDRLATRPLERVIGPSAFVARPEFEPLAARVRQWAYNAAVDAVVVGRVGGPPGAPDDDADEAVGDDASVRIEVVLRSGHSGAELARRSAIVASPSNREAALDGLAERLLVDLGFGIPQVSGDFRSAHIGRDPRSPEPALLPKPRSGTELTRSADKNPNRLGGDIALGQLRENVPIEIKADEAEIQDRGADRKLYFQRNVRVRQGDVTLESDELEAEYQKGRSEPDRLVARGSVRVDQGYRRANCDRAIFLRVEQRLMCEGRALLVQGCDVVRGDSIEFDLASDRAQVRGAASIVIRPSDGSQGACMGLGDVL